MKRLISEIILWFKWKQECLKITCYIEHPLPAGKSPIETGWYLEIKQANFNISECYYVGHLLGQDEHSRIWAIKTRKEVKERILSTLKEQLELKTTTYLIEEIGIKIKAKQQIIFYTQSIAGILISHYIPTNLFWLWMAFSLFLGHLINTRNYKQS